MDIKNININYHRNGVGGEGFFAIHFTTKDDDGTYETYEKLIAVIVPHEDEAKDECKCNGECYVVNPAHPELCYRGDHFESDMRLICKAQRVKWRTEFDKSLIAQTMFTGEIMFTDMNDVRETISPKPAIVIPKEALKPSDRRFADIIV
jgi:hypothetical protein